MQEQGERAAMEWEEQERERVAAAVGLERRVRVCGNASGGGSWSWRRCVKQELWGHGKWHSPVTSPDKTNLHYRVSNLGCGVLSLLA